MQVFVFSSSSSSIHSRLYIYININIASINNILDICIICRESYYEKSMKHYIVYRTNERMKMMMNEGQMMDGFYIDAS